MHGLRFGIISSNKASRYTGLMVIKVTAYVLSGTRIAQV